MMMNTQGRPILLLVLLLQPVVIRITSMRRRTHYITGCILLFHLYYIQTHSFRLTTERIHCSSPTRGTSCSITGSISSVLQPIIRSEENYCTMRPRRRRRKFRSATAKLHMYVIEDNHDQRKRRFQPYIISEADDDNDTTDNDDVVLYRKKVEQYYRDQKTTSHKKDWQVEWGVEYYHHHHHHRYHPTIQNMEEDTTATTTFTTNDDINYDIRNYFPSTIDEVTDAVVATITTVLRPSATTTKTTKTTATKNNNINSDPNIIHNTVYSDNIMLSRRPVRHPQYDMGRIGIELDWSNLSRNSSGRRHRQRHDDNDTNINGNTDQENDSTIRYASLILAGKLSKQQHPTTTTTATKKKKRSMPDSNTQQLQQQTTATPPLRPIAIYYNTVHQALVASHQLWQLKRLELFRRQQQTSSSTAAAVENTFSSQYDEIYIRCLCPGDDIPEELLNHRNKQEGQVSSTSLLGKQLSTGQIDPTASMILIVQPTNYIENKNEFRVPGGPSIHIIESIQRLISIAAIEQIPVVMISPRFLRAQQLQSSSVSSTMSGGYDQSGYYQQSSLYAGLEPPQGPTPWILRDFTPPVFCYVANALGDIDSDSSSNNNDKFQLILKQPRSDEYSYYSHLSLWQSVLHKGHAWNLFAAIRHEPTTTTTDGSNSNDNRHRQPGQYRFSHQCIATMKNSAGRPTRLVMRRIWDEYVNRISKES